MMEWLCGETDAKEVFEGSHPLTNAVILSLIQQLAFAINSQVAVFPMPVFFFCFWDLGQWEAERVKYRCWRGMSF